jgi:crotonobetainyl-CoA:carnitine CoA-transferase CaiB-like acyl-CoA transferase
MERPDEVTRLLDGTRVLDLTDHRGEIGPWLLAELGADVIKIEPVGGAESRRRLPLIEGDTSDLASLEFCAYNSNKRSVVLDLVAERDRFLALVATADFVFESGVPGALLDAGITHADLVAAHPRMVHVQITPFGADGPRALDPASELTISAMGGAATLQGTPERPPVKTSIPQVWRHAGTESAVAAMTAHRRMLTTGKAQRVDVSAQSAMTWTLLNAMEAHDIHGADYARAGAVAAGTARIMLRFETGDGYAIAITRATAVEKLLEWMIADGVVDDSWRDEDWATLDFRIMEGEPCGHDFDSLHGALEALFKRYPKDELMRRALEIGVTVAPINTVQDLLGFDQLVTRTFWDEMVIDGSTRRTLRSPGGPVAIDGLRVAATRRPPHIGQHTSEIMGELSGELRSAAGFDSETPTVLPADLPFDGLKVADFSWIGVGPITAKSLADHGATVIRVESNKRLDALRLNPPFKDGDFNIDKSQFFGTFNTSKQGIDIDLKSEGGMDVARRLIEWADVVIDSFTPGAMARLGLGPEDVARVNPGAITVTTSLLGGGGPLSSMAGYGYHAAALAGFYEVVGWGDLPPDGPWFAYTDTIAPRFLATTVMAAIDRRRRTGEGAHIELAQLETGLQFLAPEVLDFQVSGTVATRDGNHDPDVAPQGMFPCLGDDRWCAITVADDEAWATLRALLGEPEWSLNPAFVAVDGRLAAQSEIESHLAAWTQDQDPYELVRRLTAVGIAAGVAQRSSDLLADPQYAHRSFYRRHDHSVMGNVAYAGHQYRIEGYDHGPRFAAPAIGEHTFEVLADVLAFSPQEIGDIAASGALG